MIISSNTFVFHCVVCQLAKNTSMCLFKSVNKRNSVPFYLVHSEISMEISKLAIVSNVSKAKWFVSFTDDCTRVTWIVLLKQNYDVSPIFPNF